MCKRDPKLLIEDMLIAIKKIRRYTENIQSLEEFKANELIADAVIRNLEVLGEAARKLPTEFQEEYPDIPWRNIIGLRNIVAHGYFVVDLEIIWRVIRYQLPELEGKIERI